LQYISPTCQLALASGWFGEPFPPVKLLGFVWIWLALAVYSADGLWARRAPPQAAPRDPGPGGGLGRGGAGGGRGGCGPSGRIDICVISPGRCPGLSCRAPSGRNTLFGLRPEGAAQPSPGQPTLCKGGGVSVGTVGGLRTSSGGPGSPGRQALGRARPALTA